MEDNHFCCEGCKQVYLLLNETNLCSYYDFDKNPGIKTKGKFQSERFAYLEDEDVIKKLIQFNSGDQINVTFSLPQIHCVSCIYLLENLHKINEGIISSTSNFDRKEVFIAFNPKKISLRQVVELLAFIGYEPYISLKDNESKPKTKTNKKEIYKIGVAGFCFSNIMMLSFPEYFSLGHIETSSLKEIFTWLIFALSLPVLFFSATGFFISGINGLKQKFLNIDLPIALATAVTFSRSYYEIFTHTGSGYLDSGAGIVFFMLVGKWFQNKTYDSFSFDRDYRSYFPLGTTVIEDGIEKNIPATQLKKGSHIIIKNNEMIPADAVLVKGKALIDYSFVSGENTPIEKNAGTLIYAGGKQLGTGIELEVINETSQSYITQLWNNTSLEHAKNENKSFIHPWSRYFTLALFSIAISAAIYWSIVDSSKVLTAVTSVLIVACPCSLLLSATFTYGNMLRIFGKNKLYLKNASVIESLAKANSIVFDKTGTITQNNSAKISYEGESLSHTDFAYIKQVSKQSTHPLSQRLATAIDVNQPESLLVKNYKEISGQGIEAIVNNSFIKIGSQSFINELGNTRSDTGTQVYVSINHQPIGRFCFENKYRDGVKQLVSSLKKNKYKLSVLSGDNDNEWKNLSATFGKDATIKFYQSPQQKLDYINELQQAHQNVLMIGDGLNDAGALMKSDIGIAVSDSATQFSPACDAIISGDKVTHLNKFLAYAKAGKRIVAASFVLSILYNIVGLSFSVSAHLSPMVAAILMPISSISIVLFVTLLSTISSKRIGLQ